jgi:hypothetical protein
MKKNQRGFNYNFKFQRIALNLMFKNLQQFHKTPHKIE